MVVSSSHEETGYGDEKIAAGGSRKEEEEGRGKWMFFVYLGDQ